jgi:type IV secretory pathway TrbD component
MFKRIDRSPAIARLLERVSTILAKQRGLPIVVGIVFVIVGFIVQLVDFYAPQFRLQLVWIILHNAGILIALIGLLLADPLGK